MLFHSHSKFSIYFGDAEDKLIPSNLKNEIFNNTPILELKPFQNLKKRMYLKSLIFLDQTHSIIGHAITDTSWKPFVQQGDFLSTNNHTGIGILTADCLPIVIYDSRNHAIMTIHAGWRGSVGGIIKQALDHMQATYGSQIANLEIFFGPSAKACCYEVGRDFISHLKKYHFGEKTLTEKNGKLYFDVPLFNRKFLIYLGLRKDQFCMDYNLCTICNDTYYSYRRQGSSAGRQMTVACLKKKKEGF